MNKRKLLSGVLAAALVFGSVQTGIVGQDIAFADTEITTTQNAEGFDYEVMSDGSVRLLKYTGTKTDVVIPSQIDGKTVTSLAAAIFYDNHDITSVTIPETITEYIIPNGRNPFEAYGELKCIDVAENNPIFSSVDGVLFNKDKTKLICYPRNKDGTSYIIPLGVKTIGGSAFEYVQLENIEIPDGVEQFELFSFLGSSIKEISIPASLTTIGMRCFSACEQLVNINVADENTTFTSVDGVLYNKAQTEIMLYPLGKTDETFTIPVGVETIGEDCFFRNSTLKKLNISADVTYVGYSPFYYCLNLEEINVADGNPNYCSADGVLFNTDKTTIIAFPAGKQLDVYDIPATVKIIDSEAFNFSMLKKVTMHEGIKEIGTGAFDGCKQMTQIGIIPTSTERICSRSFSTGGGGKTINDGLNIYYAGTEEQWNAIIEQNIYGYADPTNVTVIFNCTEMPADDPTPEQPSTPTEPSTPSTPTTPSNPSTSTPSEPAPTINSQLKDEDTNVTIDFAKNVLPGGAKFTIKAASDYTTDEQTAFDITITKDNAEIQPDGSVKVTIPVPEKFKNKTELYVYHIEDGKYVLVNSKLENGNIVFETDHFSIFVISEKKLSEAGEPEAPTSSEQSSAPSESKPADNGTSGSNPATGIAFGILPVAIAAGTVLVVFKKK